MQAIKKCCVDNDESEMKPLSAEGIAALLGAEIVGECDCDMDPISIMGLPALYNYFSEKSAPAGERPGLDKGEG